MTSLAPNDTVSLRRLLAKTTLFRCQGSLPSSTYSQTTLFRVNEMMPFHVPFPQRRHPISQGRCRFNIGSGYLTRSTSCRACKKKKNSTTRSVAFLLRPKVETHGPKVCVASPSPDQKGPD
jgi:hypothetical protein